MVEHSQVFAQGPEPIESTEVSQHWLQSCWDTGIVCVVVVALQGCLLNKGNGQRATVVHLRRQGRRTLRDKIQRTSPQPVQNGIGLVKLVELS